MMNTSTPSDYRMRRVISSIASLRFLVLMAALSLSWDGIAQLTVTAPPDLLLECDVSTDTSATGVATATGGCTLLPWINEFHYDNASTDAGEFFEIAGPAGFDLTGWSIVRYNGSGGAVYSSPTCIGVGGTIDNEGNGFGALSFTCNVDGIQNGAPDGFALVDASSMVVQFLSYEGTFTAVGGAADGMMSVDVGVSETGTTLVGFSLQLIGTGNQYADFTWQAPADDSPGSLNVGQTMDPAPPGIVIDYADVTDPGMCPTLEVITRTWTATDDCGNTDEDVQTLTIQDTTPPTLSCPADVTVNPGDPTDPANTGMPSLLDDNCDLMVGATFEDVFETNCPSAPNRIVRTWTAADDCGNITTCVQSIWITCLIQEPDGACCFPDGSCQILTAPLCAAQGGTYFGDGVSCTQIICPLPCEIVCPPDPPVIEWPFGFNLQPVGPNTPQDPSVDPMIYGYAQISGDCVEPMITYQDQLTMLGNCPDSVWRLTRTWMLTEADGDVHQCVQTFYFSDTTDPSVDCVAFTFSVEWGDPIPEFPPYVTDNCGTPDVTYSDSEFFTGQCPLALIITRTWYATDNCDNVSSCTQIINVTDTTPPSITCPDDVTVLVGGSTDPMVTGYATATDNCGIPTVTYVDFPDFDNCPFETDKINRHWYATDVCGYVTTCIQFIWIPCCQACPVTCPDDEVVECDGDGNEADIAAWLDGFTSSEDCPGLEVSLTTEYTSAGLTGLTFAYDDFSDISAFTLNGSAGTIANPVFFNGQDVLRLADDFSQAGSAFISTAMNLGPDCSFSTFFTFQITDNQVTGADGITFTMQPNANTELGGAGGGIGYQGIPNSLTVEFDTWNNGDVDDSDENHVGISLNGDIDAVVQLSVFPYFENGSVWSAWVDYDGASDALEVRVREGASAPRPASPDMSYGVDLVTVFGTTDVFVGFTSGTGGASADHDIRSWGFNDSYAPIDVCGTRVIARYSATDNCGTTTTCTRTFDIVDTEGPVMDCTKPAPSVCMDHLITSFELIAEGYATAFDLCDPEPFITVIDSAMVAFGCSQTWTYTFMAIDDCGNESDTCAIIVQSYFDETPPEIMCSNPPHLGCNPLPSQIPTPQQILNAGYVTATDDCGTPIIGLIPPIVNTQSGCTRYRTYKFRATDLCGHQSPICTVTLTWTVDITPPVMDCPDDISLQCLTDPIPAPSPTTVIVTDDCALDYVTWVSDVSDGLTCPRTITRTYTAVDTCGNVSYCAQYIIIHDTTPPVIECPPTLVLECNVSIDPLTPATVEDNCTEDPFLTYTDVVYQQECGNEVFVYGYDQVISVTVRTFYATDECDNVASCTQWIIVRDDLPPALTCPPPVTLECTDDKNNLVLTGSAIVSDVCDPDAYATILVDQLVFADNCDSVWFRYWIATDFCGNGNSGTICSQSITKSDRTAPDLSCPEDVTIECGDELPSFAFYNGHGYALTDISGDWEDARAEALSMGGDLVAINDAAENAYLTATFGGAGWTWMGYNDIASEGTYVWSNGDASGYENWNGGEPNNCCGGEDRGVFNWDSFGSWNDCEEALCGSLRGIIEIPLATDNCQEVSLTYVDSDPVGSCPMVVTRTYYADDLCGNVSSCVQYITIEDTTPPSITCPFDLFVECGDPIPDVCPEVTDNCTLNELVDETSGYIDPNDPVMAAGFYSFGCFEFTDCDKYYETHTINITEGGYYTFTGVFDGGVLTFGDGMGGLFAGAFDPNNPCDNFVAGSDDDNPNSFLDPLIIACMIQPGTYTLVSTTWYCEDYDQTYSWTIERSDIAVSHVDSDTTGDCPQQVVRTFYAEDECGSVSSCTQTIYIYDTTPPEIVCPDDVTLECNVDPLPTDLATATDICNDVLNITYSDEYFPQDCDNAVFINGQNQVLMIIIRTHFATDACGNVATCTQTIMIRDDTPPMVTCPPDITIECDQDPNNTELTGTPIVSDLCDPDPSVTILITLTLYESQCSTVLQRVWQATDDCGNGDSGGLCLQLITILDTEAPEITCPDPLYLECGDELPVTAVTATDNCNEFTTTYSDHICTNSGFVGDYAFENWTESEGNGGSVTTGDNEVTLISANGSFCPGQSILYSIVVPNSGTLVFSWNYQTIDGPFFDPFGYRLNGTFHQLTDNGGGLVQSGVAAVAVAVGDVFAFDQYSYDCIFGSGATTVIDFFGCTNDEPQVLGDTCIQVVIRTHYAEDICGNVSSCVQLIYFEDTTPPSITCPATVTIECGDELPTTLATATDLCDDELEITYSDNILLDQSQCVWITIRTHYAEDDCGNVATCYQTILTIDTTPPTITCPDDVTLECGIPLPAQNATAFDICDQDVFVTLVSVESTSETDGTCLYYVIRTYRAEDNCGLWSTCTQVITIVDTTPPDLTCPEDATIECGDDLPAVVFYEGHAYMLTTEAGSWDDARAEALSAGGDLAAINDAAENAFLYNQFGGQGLLWMGYNDNATEGMFEWSNGDPTGYENWAPGEPNDYATGEDHGLFNWDGSGAWNDCDISLCGARRGIIEFNIATDNCQEVSLTYVDSDPVGACPMVVTRTYYANDGCDNESICVQYITIEDTTPPAITCPFDFFVECGDPIPLVCPNVSDICTENEPFDALSGSLSAGDELMGGAFFRFGCNDEWCDRYYDTYSFSITEAGMYVFTGIFGPETFSIESDGMGGVFAGTFDPENPCENYVAGSDDDLPGSTLDPLIITCELQPGDYTLVSTSFWCQNPELDYSWTIEYSPIVVTHVDSDTTGDCPQYITRTFYAEDECGNISSCTSTIVIIDTTPPEIVCPEDVTLECNVDPLPTDLATATDICNVVLDITYSDEYFPQDCDNNVFINGENQVLAIIIRTHFATDACGNVATCTQTIMIRDDTPPMVICPDDATIECDEDPDNLELTGMPIVEDLCDPDAYAFIIVTIPLYESPCSTVLQRVWQATDNCGNGDSGGLCLQLITILDTEAPEITCPDDVTIECGDELPVVVFYEGHAYMLTTEAGSWDDARAEALSAGGDLAAINDAAENAFLYSAFGSAGLLWMGYNDIATEGMFEWSNGDPTGYENWVPGEPNDYLTGEDHGLFNWDGSGAWNDCDISLCGARRGIIEFNIATDNCQEVSLTYVDSAPVGACPMVVTRTYYADDLCGNVSSCVQYINIEDTTPPSITCPATVTIECGDELPTMLVTATDLCDDDLEITYSDNMLLDQSNCVWLIIRTHYAEDDCGNVATCYQTILTIDTTPPTITCPNDVTLECGTPIPPVAFFEGNTYFITSVSGTWEEARAEALSLGGDLVAINSAAEDAFLNTLGFNLWMGYNDVDVEGSFEWSNGDPNGYENWLGGEPNDSAPGEDYGVMNWFGTGAWNDFGPGRPDYPVGGLRGIVELSMATDICDEDPFVTLVSEVSTMDQEDSCLYHVIRTFSATDDCGLVSYCTQVITIEDTTPPELSCPADSTVTCDEQTCLTFDDLVVSPIGPLVDASSIVEGGVTIDVSARAKFGIPVSPVFVDTETSGPDDDDLRTPNVLYGGIGINGDDPNGFETTNNEPRGVAIIVQTPGLIFPNDYILSDSLIYEFSDPVFLTSMVVVDFELPQALSGAGAFMYDAGGALLSFVPFSGGDDNNVEEVYLLQPGVSKLIVYYGTVIPTSGGIADICFVYVPCDTEAAEVSDLCNEVNVVCNDETNVLDECITEITQTYSAADACENYSESCTRVITLETDTEQPEIQCPADLTLDCDALLPAPDPSLVVATDNCTEVVFVTWVADIPMSEGDCESSMRRIYRATDECGNSAMCAQFIYFIDQTPPVIVCPGDITIECNEQIPVTSATATDDCNAFTLTYIDSAPAGDCPMVVTRTHYAEDICGNVSSCTQYIVIEDTTAPEISCPAPLTIECGEDLPAFHNGRAYFLTSSSGSWYDARNEALSMGGDLVAINDAAENAFLLGAFGSYSWLWMGYNDNALEGSFEWSNGDPNAYENWNAFEPNNCCTGEDHAVFNWNGAGAWNDCDVTLCGPLRGIIEIPIADDACHAVAYTYTDSEPVGECPMVVTRTIYATDECDNVSSCTQYIYIEDTTPPSITCPDDLTLECAVDTIPTTLATATDICDDVVDVTYVDVEYPQECENGIFIDGVDQVLSIIVRTHYATDDCGNVSSCTQHIVIRDDTPPMVTCPDNVTIECDQDPNDLMLTGVPIVTDLCDPEAYATIVITFPLYTSQCSTVLQRVWIATDHCGNGDSGGLCAQTITILDTTPPELTTCPNNMTIECGDPLPDGLVLYEGSAYMLTNVSGTWVEARNEALNLGGDLVAINDAAEDAFLSATFGINRWMGYNDVFVEGSFEWSNGDPNGYENWLGGEPNDSAPGEDYGVMNWGGTGAWNDFSPERPDYPVGGLRGVIEFAFATDNCQEVVYTYSDSEPVGTCPMVVTRTHYVSDECDNVATCIQFIYIQDSTSPDISCPDDVTIECGDDLPEPGGFSVTDICDDAPVVTYVDHLCNFHTVGFTGDFDFANWTETEVNGGTVTTSGSTQVTLVGPDGLICGGLSTLFSIVIPAPGELVFVWNYHTEDVDGPGFDPFGYNLNGTFYQLTNNGGADSQGGVAVVTVSAGDVFAFEQRSGDCILGEGATTVVDFYGCTGETGYNCDQVVLRTYIATDECGNSSACGQGIYIEDTTDPDITCPPDMTLECDQQVPYVPATATDICDDDVDITYSDEVIPQECDRYVYVDGEFKVLYLIVRTHYATDDCDNVSSCTQHIVIRDDTPPQVVCPPNVTVECGDPTDPEFTGWPEVTDNCDPNPQPVYVDLVNGECPVIITRVWSATDWCGNGLSSNVCLQIITIVDTTPPSITCPFDLAVECGDPIPMICPLATDICTASELIATVSGDLNSDDPVMDAAFFRYAGCIDDWACGDRPYDTYSLTVTVPGTYVFTGVFDGELNTDGMGGLFAGTFDADNPCLNFVAGSDDDNTGSFLDPMIITCDLVPGEYTLVSTSWCSSEDMTYTWTIERSDIALSFTDSAPEGECPMVVTRTHYAEDECGNVSSCTQHIYIYDTTPPSITCPDDLTLECAVDTIPTTLATATDICDDVVDVTYVDVEYPQDCENGVFIEGVDQVLTVIVRTHYATDNCGNVSSCTQHIIIRDDTPPSVTCPADVTIECDQDPNNLELTGVPIVADLCDPDAYATIIITFPLYTSPCSTVLQRVWLATDQCGNGNSGGLCAQTITILDTTPPEILCPFNLSIECGDELPAVVVYEGHAYMLTTEAGSWDDARIEALNAGGDLAAINDAAENAFLLGAFGSYSWLWMGYNDNALEGSFEWSNGDPNGYENWNAFEPNNCCTGEDHGVFNWNGAGAWNDCDISLCGALRGIIELNIATDNCQEVSLTYVDSDPVGTCPMVVTRTYYANDECGNVSTCIQFIYIEDTTAPEISCPDDVTIECGDDLPEPGGFSITDICDDAPVVTYVDHLCNFHTVGFTGDFDFANWTETEVNGGTVTTSGSTQVTLVGPDGLGCGGLSTLFSIVIPAPGELVFVWNYHTEDVDGPGFDPFGYNLNGTFYQLTNNGGADSQGGVAVVTVSAGDVFAFEQNSGDCILGEGATTVVDFYGCTGETGYNCDQVVLRTYIATDECGNSSACGQGIYIEDTTAPDITCPPDMTLECDQQVPYVPATVTDICDDDVDITYSEEVIPQECDRYVYIDGEFKVLYLIVRTHYATDDCGNVSSCTQHIIVRDDTPPVVVCPPNITIECDEPTGPDNTGWPDVTDNCDPNPQPIYVDLPPSGNSCSSTFIRVWTATDWCGNGMSSNVCIQFITIVDTTPPSISCPDDMIVECGDPIPMICPMATDNCGSEELIASFSGELVDGDPLMGGAFFNGFCNDAWGCDRYYDTYSLTVTEAGTYVFTGVFGPELSFSPEDDGMGGLFAGEFDPENPCDNFVAGSDDDSPGSFWDPQIFTCVLEPGEYTLVSTSFWCSNEEMNYSWTITLSDVTLTSVDSDPVGNCPMVITRTHYATDECGNVSICTQLIYIEDTTPPAITCPDDVTLECNVDPIPTTLATVSDACDDVLDVTYVDVEYPQDCANDVFVDGVDQVKSIIVRTHFATDDCGNTSSCTQHIVIRDDTPPAITCPDDVTIECDQDPNDLMLTGVPIVSDLCDPEAYATIIITFPVYADPCSTVLQRVWLATDMCGNGNSGGLCTQYITIVDTTPPQLTSCPSDVTIECGDPLPAPLSAFYGGHAYALTNISGTWEEARAEALSLGGDLVAVNDAAEDAFLYANFGSSLWMGYNDVTTEGTWVWSNGDPSGYENWLPGEPNDAFPGEDYGVLNWGGGDWWNDFGPERPDYPVGGLRGVIEFRFASDNCQEIVYTYSDSAPEGNCPMVITRTHYASDGCGNVTTCVQQIFIEDTTPPSITCPPTITIECGDPLPTTLATATDICDDVVDVTYVDGGSIDEGQCAWLVLRTHYAEDDCGNVSSCVQVILIVDTTPPVISCPADATVECGDEVGGAGVASATDACDPDVFVTIVDEVVGAGSCSYTIIRTYQAWDDCGNSSTCTQVIIVEDTTAPEVICPPDETFSCDELTCLTFEEYEVNGQTGPLFVIDQIIQGGVTIDISAWSKGGVPRDAVLFNTADPNGDDLDLGTPNTLYGGPGVNDDDPDGFEPTNNRPLGNILIVQSPGFTYPNDYFLSDSIVMAFSDPVYMESVVVMDFEAEQLMTGAGIYLYDAGGALISFHPLLGDGNDNSQEVVSLKKAGVSKLKLYYGTAIPSSGGISSLCYVYIPCETEGVLTIDACNEAQVFCADTTIVVNDCTTEIVRTYTAEDACGNVNEVGCTQTLTLNTDNLQPDIMCPADISIGCEEEVPAPDPGSVAATDNCSAEEDIVIAWVEDISEGLGCAEVIRRIYSATDECGNTALCVQYITREGIPEQIVFLGQVFLQAVMMPDTSMDARLNDMGYLPNDQPYNMAPFDYWGAEHCDELHPDIVDWVLVQLRDVVTMEVVAQKAGLVKENGMIVAEDCVSPITFTATGGYYYLTVLHRNHLGIVTDIPMDCNEGWVMCDFTEEHGTMEGMVEYFDGVYAMTRGDVNGDNLVKYNGSNNDKNAVLSAVGILTPNNVVPGYNRYDVNMDGVVKYNGSNNDKNAILSVVGLLTPNNIVAGALYE